MSSDVLITARRHSSPRHATRRFYEWNMFSVVRNGVGIGFTSASEITAGDMIAAMCVRCGAESSVMSYSCECGEPLELIPVVKVERSK